MKFSRILALATCAAVAAGCSFHPVQTARGLDRLQHVKGTAGAVDSGKVCLIGVDGAATWLPVGPGLARDGWDGGCFYDTALDLEGNIIWRSKSGCSPIGANPCVTSVVTAVASGPSADEMIATACAELKEQGESCEKSTPELKKLGWFKALSPLAVRLMAFAKKVRTCQQELDNCKAAPGHALDRVPGCTMFGAVLVDAKRVLDAHNARHRATGADQDTAFNTVARELERVELALCGDLPRGSGR